MRPAIAGAQLGKATMLSRTRPSATGDQGPGIGASAIGSLQSPHPLAGTRDPRSPSNYLIAGILIGLVFGFVMGTLVALNMGDKSLLFAQHLWNRIFNEEAEGERVHFEWLLQ